MPSNASSGMKTYHALPPPKEQKVFPKRRRSVRPNARRSTRAKPEKDQSTLTQYDFDTTPSANSGVFAIPSDGDDDEYGEPRPKKKRKKSTAKERGQKTLTQIDRDGLFKKSQREEIDDDGWQIWCDDVKKAKSTVGENQIRGTRSKPWLVDDNRSPEKGNKAQKAATFLADEEIQSPRTDSETGKAKRARTNPLITPRKVRFTEVPSSQSPQSARLSGRSSAILEGTRMSPLSAKSRNIQTRDPVWQSPKSQNISMKMLERVRFAQQKFQPNKIQRSHLSSAEKGLRTPVTSRPGGKSRPEDIPVNEDEELGFVQDSQCYDPILDDITAFKRSKQQRRKLKRAATIQDSQSDDADLELDAVEASSEASGVSYDEHTDNGSECGAAQGTFDPANSALDRDAARFGWTQATNQGECIDENHVDSETDDDDLDRGCSPFRDRGAIPSSGASSQGVEELIRAPNPGKHNITIEASGPLAMKSPQSGKSAIPSRVLDDVANGSRDVANGSRDVVYVSDLDAPPSSPPLRTSQISTVVPTQDSPKRSSPRTANAPRSLQTISAMQQSTPSSSPHQTSDALRATPSPALESSSLPLPPWNSPEGSRLLAKSSQEKALKPVTKRTQLESLPDFSLPPPPPLSWGGRMAPTPSSSK